MSIKNGKKLKIFGALPKDTDKENDLTDTISLNTNNKTKEKDQNKIVYIHKKFLLKIFLINFLAVIFINHNY